jgi:hypothetical protein
MNKFKLLSIIFILFAATAFAQDTISGVVIDSDKEPLISVKVYQEKENYIFTNFDGIFQFILSENKTNTNNIKYEHPSNP